MTKPLAFERAGGDRPHRRPGSMGWSAARAAILSMLGLLLALSLNGQAQAQTSPELPESPLVIGPGPAVPPPAPGLPGSNGGRPHKGAGTGANGSGHEQGNDRHKGGNGGKAEAALQGTCTPFVHTQTYPNWGPAVAYGGPVTVAYEADRCSTPDGSALDVSAEGTAMIYDGLTTDGTLLDTRSFSVTGTWQEPQNAEAWPPTWWTCSVPYASYTWEIPGVYTFRVSAQDGVWSLDVSSSGVGTQDVSWTHDGCA